MSAFLLCAALFLPQFGLTNDGSAEVTASFAATEIGAGSVLALQITLDISEGWHAYHPDQDPENGIPVSVEVSGQGWAAAGALLCLQEPIPHTLEVGDFKADYLWIKGNPTFTLPVRVPTTVGKAELTVDFTYQLCNDSSCLPPATKSLKVALLVTDAAATGLALDVPENAASTDTPPEAGLGAPLPTDLWAFLLTAIIAGAATLLTPCVFPMIPVTISYFTKRSESGKGTAVGNATAYAAGIIFTFVGIGGGAAVLMGATGANQIGSNPWVNTAIGILFVVMAVSLLGYYEIQAPRFLQKFAANTQASGRSKMGYLPVAMMGVVFSITAFTCTVAFVGAVFAAGLKLGKWYLFGGMFVYGFVFALPFFFLALFPSRLRKMPNAGGWMNTVKVCAGFVELVAAMKFFSNADLFWDFEILTWPIVLGFSAIVMLVWAAYMFGLFKMPHDYEKPKPGKVRVVFAVAILAGGVYLLPGVFNRDFKYAKIIYAFTPPPTYGLAGDIGPAGLTWSEDYDEAFSQALVEGKPLFLDFTGVTCPNCRSMEHGVFPDDAVKPLLKKFVRAELWVDKIKVYAEMEVQRFQQASQPFYALIDPRDDSVLATFPGYNPDPSKFAVFLQKGLDGYAANTQALAK